GAPRYPHSFPTRRSSDLKLDCLVPVANDIKRVKKPCLTESALEQDSIIRIILDQQNVCRRGIHIKQSRFPRASNGEKIQHLSPRSEEHTSELQSPCNLVC